MPLKLKENIPLSAAVEEGLTDCTSVIAAADVVKICVVGVRLAAMTICCCWYTLLVGATLTNVGADGTPSAENEAK
jgi:hypothetical protein